MVSVRLIRSRTPEWRYCSWAWRCLLAGCRRTARRGSARWWRCASSSASVDKLHRRKLRKNRLAQSGAFNEVRGHVGSGDGEHVTTIHEIELQTGNLGLHRDAVESVFQNCVAGTVQNAQRDFQRGVTLDYCGQIQMHGH